MKRHQTFPLILTIVVFFLTAVLANAQNKDDKEIYFSTEEDFITQGPEPADGNPIISDGDLLDARGVVYMRNSELLQIHKIPFDLGLDAACVVHSGQKIVAFSTEIDAPNGAFREGDLLVTNGAIIPNYVLLHNFDLNMGRGMDLGLDALHIQGESEQILTFLNRLVDISQDEWMEKPETLSSLAETLKIDIWFSTEGTAPTTQTPKFLDGDLLSITGAIIAKNSDLLPASVPAGIPSRGVDFGLDAVARLHDPIEQMGLLLYSTEINGGFGSFSAGDAMIGGGGVVFSAQQLIRPFEPRAYDLGLDALSISITETVVQRGRFTRIGGLDVNGTTWDFSNGYTDPSLAGVKDHTFGGWVSVRGVLPPGTVRHRILVRPDGGADAPILMPAGLGGPLGWQVYNHPLSVWQPVVIDGDGWMSTSHWMYLKDFCQNPDLIFVNWQTTLSSTPDGKYILSLETEHSGGTVAIIDTVAVQIDNTRPLALMSDNNECHEFTSETMPLDIQAAISDAHFSNYHLRLDSYWIPATGFGNGYYLNGPPLNSQGTIGFPTMTSLASLDIPAVVSDPPGGRYTVLLYAYDRSLIGSFAPKVNYISDANPNPSDRDDRNWNYAITNFEFYP